MNVLLENEFLQSTILFQLIMALQLVAKIQGNHNSDFL